MEGTSCRKQEQCSVTLVSPCIVFATLSRLGFALFCVSMGGGDKDKCTQA